MGASNSHDRRRIVPRWRPWKIARASGEMDPIRPDIKKTAQKSITADREGINKKVRDFLATPGLHEASDLLGAAITLGSSTSPELLKAADFIDNDPKASATMRRQVRFFHSTGDSPNLEEMDTINDEVAKERIAQLRAFTRFNPRNAISWTDLAHAHAVRGEIHQATKEIRIAQALASNNRFVVRSTVRLLLCIEDIERAHEILKRTEAANTDPWLAATQLAVCDVGDLAISNIRRYRRMLEADLAPWHKSELASALASLEIRDGRTKRAKKLMRLAVEDPTENSLAQAEWSATQGVDVVRPGQLDKPRGYEARARHAFRTRNYTEGISEARKWLLDQPFALDPSIFLSYAAATAVGDYETAMHAARIGLRYSPHNPLLLNNLAYSLALSDRPKEAQEVLNRRTEEPDKIDQCVLIATRGLVAYRAGRIDEGRTLYTEATSQLKTIDTIAYTIATIHWAQEEARVKGDLANQLLTSIEAAPKAYLEYPELEDLRTRVLRSAIRPPS